MVSLDSAEKNKEFAESVGAGLVLLSDPEKAAAKAYGVLGIGGFYAKRRTFFIDSQGVIQHIDNDVDTKSHGRDIARKLDELGWRSSSRAEGAPPERSGAP
jgi:peroxiredoxin Q/BCP